MVEDERPWVAGLEVAEEQQHRNRGNQGDQVGHRGLGGRVLEDATLLAPHHLVAEPRLEHNAVGDEQRRGHDRQQHEWRRRGGEPRDHLGRRDVEPYEQGADERRAHIRDGAAKASPILGARRLTIGLVWALIEQVTGHGRAEGERRGLVDDLAESISKRRAQRRPPLLLAGPGASSCPSSHESLRCEPAR